MNTENSNNDPSTINDLKIVILDRNAPISNARGRRNLTIEEIRQQIIDKADRKILVGNRDGKMRAAIIRGPFRVASMELPGAEALDEDTVRNVIIQKLKSGFFDQAITVEYEKQRVRDRTRRKELRLMG